MIKYELSKSAQTTMFLGLLVHILFNKFKEKTIFFSRSPLLQTLGITDSKSPPDGVGNNGSRTVIISC